MKIAVVGSRKLRVENIGQYIPENCDEIVSGGAVGIDRCAAEYAAVKNIKLTEFLPIYEKYGRGAPIERNRQIVDYADEILAFWDGNSRGTLSVIKYAENQRKPCRVIILEE